MTAHGVDALLRLHRRVLDERERSLSLIGLRFALYRLSLIYGFAVRIRRLLYRAGLARSFKLPVQTVCVGNISAGGTGKTPLVIYTARLLRSYGKRVAVISRGYRRRSRGVVVASNGVGDPAPIDQIGEEAYLMAQKLRDIPVLVGEDRFTVGRLAVERFSPDVLILDDGFQHLRLERDLDILAIDTTNPFGGGYLLPRGTLREPLEVIKQADLLCLTRGDQSDRVEALKKALRSIHPEAALLVSVHRPRGFREFPEGRRFESTFLQERRVFALSAIGNPPSFERTLSGLGAEIVGRRRYPDHHRYNLEELNSIAEEAIVSAELIVTTEKDAVGFPADFIPAVRVMILEIEIEIVEGRETFCYMLRNLR